MLGVDICLLKGFVQCFDVRRLIDGVVMQLLQYAQIPCTSIKPAGKASLTVITERVIPCPAPDKLRLTVSTGFAVTGLFTDTDNIVEVKYVPAFIDFRHRKHGSYRIIRFLKGVQQYRIFFQQVGFVNVQQVEVIKIFLYLSDNRD
uniref:Uncharacterized protein n=1 Tax=Xenorhabdus hominickii TaxID=351679 RepID=A0A1V0M4S5_XENHO|nr:hypothetical protein [Xenorhabdus hominickii]